MRPRATSRDSTVTSPSRGGAHQGNGAHLTYKVVHGERGGGELVRLVCSDASQKYALKSVRVLGHRPVRQLPAQLDLTDPTRLERRHGVLDIRAARQHDP